MFVIPMACLLLMVSGQTPVYDVNDNPEGLVTYALRVLHSNDSEKFPRMISEVEAVLKKDLNSYYRERFSTILEELKSQQRAVDAKESFLKNLNPEVDKDLHLLRGFVQVNMYAGMDSFLAQRPRIEKSLENSFKPTKINKSNALLLRKALNDMDRLAELKQDPFKRAEAAKFFSLLENGTAAAEIPPDEKDQTGYLIHERQKAEMAKRLFGTASFAHFFILNSVLCSLQCECRMGKLTEVNLASEVEKELACFLQSDWNENVYIQRLNLMALANACLTERAKNHSRLKQIIQDLEELETTIHSPGHADFLYIDSYRLAMLSQQGLHEECIQEFQKIKPYNLAHFSQWEILTDIYLSVAKAYEAINKKDLALDYQDLAFNACMQIPSRARLLTSWRISIAKDLRDKLANNKQWPQARSLEERCKLFGIGFEPLPKQAFE